VEANKGEEYCIFSAGPNKRGPGGPRSSRPGGRRYRDWLHLTYLVRQGNRQSNQSQFKIRKLFSIGEEKFLFPAEAAAVVDQTSPSGAEAIEGAAANGEREDGAELEALAVEGEEGRASGVFDDGAEAAHLEAGDFAPSEGGAVDGGGGAGIGLEAGAVEAVGRGEPDEVETGGAGAGGVGEAGGFGEEVEDGRGVRLAMGIGDREDQGAFCLEEFSGLVDELSGGGDGIVLHVCFQITRLAVRLGRRARAGRRRGEVFSLLPLSCGGWKGSRATGRHSFGATQRFLDSDLRRCPGREVQGGEVQECMPS
jgi:hypothetical protein